MPTHPVSRLKVVSRLAPSASQPSGWRGVRLQGRRGTPALHELTLEIAPGERLALLGPTGAGKTAALMLLAGFARADAGTVLLQGEPAGELPPHRRDLGVVFQDDVLLPHLTVARNVAFPLEARSVPRDESHGRLDRALDAFGLSRVAHRRPRDLSRGECVRAALARAVIADPSLLLLDDPFACLDAPTREEVMADLVRVLDGLDGAVLLATRDPAEALALGGRVAVLQAGRLLQAGRIQAVYDAPASEAVAHLLGEANCLPGMVEAVVDGVARVRLACGPAVEADPGGVAAPGRTCLVLIRPERIAVAAVAAAEMGEGALPAEVLSLAWRGDHVRLMLRLGAGGPESALLSVRRPAGAALGGLTPGGQASVAWQPPHARVLPRWE